MALSVICLVAGAGVLFYSLLSMAHVRVDAADMAQLNRLRAEGVLPDVSPEDADWVGDFIAVRRRLAQIAPAVYFRQEPWLHLYFYLVRLVLWMRPEAAWYRKQLLQCNAYQAARYRMALDALHALQYPSL